MMYYRTSLVGTKDGLRTFGVVELLQPRDNSYRVIGRTNQMRVYPQNVRAREAARKLAFRHAIANGHDPRVVTILPQ